MKTLLLIFTLGLSTNLFAAKEYQYGSGVIFKRSMIFDMDEIKVKELGPLHLKVLTKQKICKYPKLLSITKRTEEYLQGECCKDENDHEPLVGNQQMFTFAYLCSDSEL